MLLRYQPYSRKKDIRSSIPWQSVLRLNSWASTGTWLWALDTHSTSAAGILIISTYVLPHCPASNVFYLRVAAVFWHCQLLPGMCFLFVSASHSTSLCCDTLGSFAESNGIQWPGANQIIPLISLARPYLSSSVCELGFTMFKALSAAGREHWRSEQSSQLSLQQALWIPAFK